MPKPASTFGRFLPLAENRLALAAVQELAEAIAQDRVHRVPQPLYLHGPAGSGKSHLAGALAHDTARRRPDLVICQVQANTLIRTGILAEANVQGALFDSRDAKPEEPTDPLDALRAADLVIVEDIQYLRPGLHASFAQLLDDLVSECSPVLITGLSGPAHLIYRQESFPVRLRNRLSAGLTVELKPLAVESRRLLLAELAQRRQLAMPLDVLSWVAEKVNGGVRALEGALTTLEQLNRSRSQPLDLACVSEEFSRQADAPCVTVEKIAEQVGGYFRVSTDQLQSRSRLRGILVARQVGMYLARQLTQLSLGEIGAFFGGRDHTTVLHACRKVAAALDRDAALLGAVRQLQVELN